MIAKIKSAIKKINPRSLHFIILVLVIILIPFIVLIITLSQEQLSPNSTPRWKNYQEQVKNGDIMPAGKILEIVMDYKSDKNPQLSINELSKKNGYAPSVIAADHDYRVQLINSKKLVISEQYFSIPNKVRAETVDDNGVIHGKDVDLSDVSLAVSLSWKEGATEIRIIDKNRKQILTSNLSNLEEVNNKPKFNSIRGDEMLKKEINFNLFENMAYAQTNDGKLDVVFIGDNYTDMSAFRSDVDRVTAKFLSLEPFKSRASLIAFHIVENTTDLECAPAGNTIGNRLLVCKNSLVKQQINNAGAPSDVINVLVNTPDYGGSGGEIAVGYNGPNAPELMVHEFGHVFGRLLDEYSYEGESNNGIIDNKIHALGSSTDGNCFAGSPPSAEWNGLAEVSDYRMGCRYLNWNASSQTSIMHTLEAGSHFFNKVSQGVMNRRLNIIAQGGNPNIGTEGDVYAINRNGASGKTEAHVLTGATNFKDFSIHAVTGLHSTAGNTWSFALGGFYDDDYLPDVYAINRNGGSGKTEVHVLSGKSNFADFALHAVTGLEATTSDNWVFDVGNGPDEDPRADLFAINKQGGSGKTEVHILQGGTGKDYKDFSLHAGTGLHTTDKNWNFATGNFTSNSKGDSDIYAINRNGASGKTEVHVLSVASNYSEFSLHAVTPLEATDNANWIFTTGYFDNDLKADLYAINRKGASGKTEVHILSAASDFKEFVVHAASGLEATNNSNWIFPPSQDFPSSSSPNPTATVAPTSRPTNPPNITVNPTGITPTVPLPTSGITPTGPVPTFVCGGSPHSVCNSPTPTPGNNPNPTISMGPNLTTTPSIIPTAGPNEPCLDPQEPNFIQKIFDWVNNLIKSIFGNPNQPPTDIKPPCVKQ